MSDDEIRVHPAAAVFPMLSDDELADLAADIKANGLLHPIKLDREGRIVDGRNRDAACKLANVDPEYEVLDHGVDPVAYILSENIHRRHLSAGQRAMAIAKMLDLDGGRTGARTLTFAAKVSESRVSYASTVLRYAPDLVEQVEAGASLDAAYRSAVERKRTEIEREQQALDEETRRAARLAELERERAEIVAAIKGAEREIGPAVTIPREPELALRLDDATEVERATVPSGDLDVDSLKAQQRLHDELQRAKKLLAAIQDVPVDPDSAMFEGLVMAVRSWATQVVALTYGIVDRYNVALDESGQLRRVK